MFGSFYVFVVLEIDQPTIVKIGFCIFAAYLGMQSAVAVPEEPDHEAADFDPPRLSRMRSICC